MIKNWSIKIGFVNVELINAVSRKLGLFDNESGFKSSIELVEVVVVRDDLVKLRFVKIEKNMVIFKNPPYKIELIKTVVSFQRLPKIDKFLIESLKTSPNRINKK